MFVSRPRLITVSGALASTVAAALILSVATVVAAPTQAAAPRPAADDRGTAPASAVSPDFVPAAPMVQVLRQPDGTTFSATLSPARTGGLFETAQGYSVERDDAGIWHYVLGRDANGAVELSDQAVGSGAAPSGLQKHTGRQPTKVNAAEQAIRNSIQRQLQIASREAQLAAAAAGQPRVFRVPALMLATYYDEAAGESAPQFQGAHSAAYFKKVLDGFGGNPTGSMTQFYYEASFGQFLVKVDVYGPYTSERSQGDPCYYGGIDDSAGSDTDPVGSTLGVGGGGALGMAVEAVPQADADIGGDWGDYDNDGDGRVDFTMLIHSGGDMAATGNPCFTWSHAIQATLGQCETLSITYGIPAAACTRSGIPTSTPGTFVDRVLTIPEYASDVDPLAIGVAVHEMAHAIGEPDYYDTSYSSVGTGDYDAMAGGSYLGNPSGSNPTMMSPVSRIFQGWLTPTIVRKSLKGYKLKARTALPRKGYRVGQPDRNLLLVPTYEIKEGQTDKLGHTWGADDVYGLPYNGKTKKYVVEGFYVENVSRHAKSPRLSSKNPMGSMFDRRSHGSGLMVWHFDYWRQSTTYFAHGNDAQNDPQRYQLDVEEFDRNDNTQELQLNYSRGNPADYLTAAATGITSGTRMLPPGIKVVSGGPQAPIDISGTTPPTGEAEASFAVANNRANTSMSVSVTGLGDCTLELIDPAGKSAGKVDAGFAGGEETVTVTRPAPGTWKALVGDFAGCGPWDGQVTFEGSDGFITAGAADTWSNWSKKPTGWAFTNVSGHGNGIDVSNEAGGSDAIKLDVLNLSRKKDVSPGFITGELNKAGGATGLTVGKNSKLSVPVFSNGGKKPGMVQVTVRDGSATGKVVARKTVMLKAYERKIVSFRYRAKQEGPLRLVTVVDENRKVKEGSERNQVQVTTLWAGPRRPKVLIVDDDQVLAHEQAIAGGLAALGIPYAIAQAHPSAKQMRKYAAVVWESSVDRYEGQLDKRDRAALRSYLNRGGRLLVTSNRIFDAIGGLGSPQSAEEGVRFGAQYLGARIPEGNTTYVVTQPKVATVTGAGLLGKGKRKLKIGQAPTRPFIGLAGLSSAGNGGLGSVIKPFGKAAGVFTLDKASLAAVVPASDKPFIGIAVKGDKAHKGFRTVTLGWNLGDNVNAGDTVQVLKSVMKFFQVKRNRYQVRTAQPVIYSSAVRDQVSGRATKVTAIVLGGKAKPVVKLYYRRHGLGKFYSVTMKKSGSGAYTAKIPGKAFTPEGVDYYIKAGKTVDPFGSSTAPLYHGVGVSLPKIKKPLKIKR